MQVPDLIRKYPFTGAAEALGTLRKRRRRSGETGGILRDLLGGRAEVIGATVWFLALGVMFFDIDG